MAITSFGPLSIPPNVFQARLIGSDSPVIVISSYLISLFNLRLTADYYIDLKTKTTIIFGFGYAQI